MPSTGICEVSLTRHLEGKIMSFVKISNKPRSRSLSKALCVSSASTVLLAAMVFAPAAQAQVTVDVTDCADLESGTFDNPGTADMGATVNIDVNDECTLASGDIIELEDGNQDDVIINIASGSLLTSTDTSDEDTVIFIDNAENNTTINIDDGAVLSGVNGVIFLEGDGVEIENNGQIIGTGAAEEGVIYFDRDTDGDLNNLVNGATGQIIAQADGPAIGIETLIADGADDLVDVGNQDAFTDFPTIRILNEGLIASQGTATNDDNDGINVAGNPGETNDIVRACIESGALNCIVNLRIINEGTISSVADSSSNAGITFEDDALFFGGIVNRQNGVITGTRNGIRIGDVVVDGQTAEHSAGPNRASSSARINNLGTISGTGTSSRGIDLEGDSVRITNSATGTISGVSVGIEVGAGTSSGIAHSGLNNSIFNSGTISGSNFSIDSSNAEGAIRINSTGGTFTGDIRGSLGNEDLFIVGAGTTTLTHDILQDFDVRVAQTGTLAFDGDRTIEGDLDLRGVGVFDIANTQTVTGDVNLRSTSTIALTDVDSVGALGAQYTLLDVGGTLVNDSTLDTTDSSLLLDFVVVVSNDLVVEAVLGVVGKPSEAVSGFVDQLQFTNSSANAFGETVLTAFAEGGLNNTATFSNLAGISTAGDLGIALNSLAPDYNGTLLQNVFNTIQNGADQVDYRLNDLACNEFGDSRVSASFGSESLQSCLTFAQSGAWVQSSHGGTTQGSLSSAAPTFLTGGLDQDSITMVYGYDQAISDSTVLGFSGSYTETQTADNNLAASSTELDIVQLSAYTGHRVGNAHFVTKASFSHGEADTRRQSFDVIRSEVDINAINAQSVASYNVNLGQGYYLKPEAGLHYNNITTGSFLESGGLNLAVNEATSNVLDGRVGLTLGARKLIADNTRANVFVTGALRNDIYGSRDDIGFNFSGQAGSLAVANLDQFAVQALAGINILSGENFTFGGAVNSEFSQNENSVGGRVQTRIRW